MYIIPLFHFNEICSGFVSLYKENEIVFQDCGFVAFCTRKMKVFAEEVFSDSAQICHLKDAKADLGDVMQKVKVNSDDAEPLYKHFKGKQGGYFGKYIKWNFTNRLIALHQQQIPLIFRVKLKNCLRDDIVNDH